MEKIGPGVYAMNIGTTLYENNAANNNGVLDIIHRAYVSLRFCRVDKDLVIKKSLLLCIAQLIYMKLLKLSRW